MGRHRIEALTYLARTCPVRSSVNGQPFFPDSCGTCSSCTKTEKLINPDIHFSYPVVSRKSGDKPLSTDYISEWREFIHLPNPLWQRL